MRAGLTPHPAPHRAVSTLINFLWESSRTLLDTRGKRLLATPPHPPLPSQEDFLSIWVQFDNKCDPALHPFDYGLGGEKCPNPTGRDGGGRPRPHLSITLSQLNKSGNGGAWSKPLDHSQHHLHMLNCPMQCIKVVAGTLAAPDLRIWVHRVTCGVILLPSAEADRPSPEFPKNPSPPPPLDNNRLHATGSSHGRGNIPKVTPPPLREHKGMHDTRQNMQTRGHTNHKKTRKLPVGMHVELY